jgi:ketosteroid isomerase-like protein
LPISPWIRELFADIDRMDARAFAAHLTDDALFRFGSQPPARGRAAAQAAVEAFFGMIAGLRHELHAEWRAPDSVVVEGQVTYRRRDRSEIVLPFADVLDLEGDKVARYKIYMDAAPLFAPLAPS